MMAGEIEYENFIYENGDALFGFTGHAMILIFVVLVSIILMNLLVGLAVSEIQNEKINSSLSFLRPIDSWCASLALACSSFPSPSLLQPISQ